MNPEGVFDAELWIWTARDPATWTFVTLPVELADEVREAAALRPPSGFGAVRVEVVIGGSTWRTSVFPSTSDDSAPDGSYVLPVKRAVRLAEGIEPGDVVTVAVRVV